MLTSSQWTGVLISIQKKKTLFHAWDPSCITFNFFFFLHHLEVEIPKILYSLGNSCLTENPLTPSEFPVVFCGGGLVLDIFWNYINYFKKLFILYWGGSNVSVSILLLYRAVHSGGAGGAVALPGKLNVFFFSNIVFDFAGIFLGAILVRNLKKTD